MVPLCRNDTQDPPLLSGNPHRPFTIPMSCHVSCLHVYTQHRHHNETPKKHYCRRHCQAKTYRNFVHKTLSFARDENFTWSLSKYGSALTSNKQSMKNQRKLRAKKPYRAAIMHCGGTERNRSARGFNTVTTPPRCLSFIHHTRSRSLYTYTFARLSPLIPLSFTCMRLSSSLFFFFCITDNGRRIRRVNPTACD